MPTSFKLANGLTVLVNERPGLPVVSMNLVVKSGSDANPIDKAGLANFTATMLDEGTTTRTTMQIADEVAQLGGALGESASLDVWIRCRWLRARSSARSRRCSIS